MDGTPTILEDSPENTQETQQPNPLPEKSREETISTITQIVDSLFAPNNLVNSSYFFNRAVNESLEIPIKFIYNERSIRNETLDYEIVNEALENATNIILNKKGDIIRSVFPKYNEGKRKVTINNIPKEKKEEFRNFVNSHIELPDGDYYWYYNHKLGMVTIICIEEELATQVFDTLKNIKFNEEDLDCSLDSYSVYMLGLDIIKKKSKSYPYMNNPMNQLNQMNQMFVPYSNPYNQYPMYPSFFPTPANNFYVTNHYQNMNYYYQPGPTIPYMKPMFTPNAGMNLHPTPLVNMDPNPNPSPSMNKKPYNPNYKNDKKPYVKKNKQPRDKNYKYNNNRVSTKSSSIEVNDNDFPPL